jgi:hypothetical protein
MNSTALNFDTIALFAFFVLLLIATVFSIFIIYHWNAYGEHKATNSAATYIYICGVLLAFGGMMTALIAIL